MRRTTSLAVLLVWMIGGIPSSGYAQAAQGKQACDLVTRADVEAILGVPVEEGTSTPDGGMCSFTNAPPNKPRPAKRVDVQVLVNYSAAPDPAAVEKQRKFIDEKTYHNPIDLPEIRHCRQVQVGSFSTQHGRGAISPGGATTTVGD